MTDRVITSSGRINGDTSTQLDLLMRQVSVLQKHVQNLQRQSQAALTASNASTYFFRPSETLFLDNETPANVRVVTSHARVFLLLDGETYLSDDGPLGITGAHLQDNGSIRTCVAFSGGESSQVHLSFYSSEGQFEEDRLLDFASISEYVDACAVDAFHKGIWVALGPVICFVELGSVTASKTLTIPSTSGYFTALAVDSGRVYALDDSDALFILSDDAASWSCVIAGNADANPNEPKQILCNQDSDIIVVTTSSSSYSIYALSSLQAAYVEPLN